jgi:hypothetical protein
LAKFRIQERIYRAKLCQRFIRKQNAISSD